MYELLDGVKANKENPDTFQIPSDTEKRDVKVDDYVKLGFIEKGKLVEKMWVEVKMISGDTYLGILDNDPFNLEEIKFGDKVWFHSKHIIGLL